MDDRLENKAEEMKGRAKEATGAVTGDDHLKAEGKTDQHKADLKDKVNAAKDKVAEKMDDIL